MTEPRRDLAAEARDVRLAGLPNGQAHPAEPFRPSFPPGGGDALAAVREAIPLLRDVPMGGAVYPVVPPPVGDGRNVSEPSDPR